MSRLNAVKRIVAATRRFSAEDAGAAAIEFVEVFPVIASLIALVVFAGEGFEISRKVTMVVRTLTDLVSQQTNIGSSSSTYTYTQILSAASLVITPYDSTQLSMVISEIQTNGSGSGTVIWSKANSNGTALSTGASVTVPTNITTSSYFILGQASYSFNPISFYIPLTTFNITDQLYLVPRAGASVSCCT